MKIFKKILLGLFVILLVAQFFGPDKNQGDICSVDAFIAETKPSDEVHTILKQACFDCHTDATRYPWYNNITPVNYWIDDHIKHGKGDLNFSKWSEYSLKRKEHKFEEIWEEVQKKHMPLDSYTWIHSDAKLSQEQIDQVVGWAKQVQANYKNQMNQE